MLLLPGRALRRILLRRLERSADLPLMSARQQGRPACRRHSAPFPGILSHRLRGCAVASPANALPKDLPEILPPCAGRKPPRKRLPRSTTRHAVNLPPKGRERTHARPSALSHQRRALTQDEKRGGNHSPLMSSLSARRNQRLPRQDYSSLPSSARAKSCGSNGRRSSIFSPRPTKVMGSSN